MTYANQEVSDALDSFINVLDKSECRRAKVTVEYSFGEKVEFEHVVDMSDPIGCWHEVKVLA